MQPKHPVSRAIIERARELRHDQTEAEAVLWQAIRNRHHSYKFRRQQPIGRFVIDFYCHEALLCVEIDGDSHSEPAQQEYDNARTQYLEETGYGVIRFTNRDVQTNLHWVLDEISRTIESRILQLAEEREDS